MKSTIRLILMFAFGFLSCAGSSDPAISEELPTLSIEAKTFHEGDTNNEVLIEINLSKASSQPVSGFVEVIEGTAKAGADFIRSTNTAIDIQPGERTATITLNILGDTEFENDETFSVSLFSIEGAVFRGAVEFTIQNDDLDPIQALRNELSSIVAGLDGPSSPESYEGMVLTWRDEFDGATLNANKWTEEFGDNWFNEELQSYTNNGRNQLVGQGNLVIEAREEKSPFGGDNPYTSARVFTKGKFDFTYGRVDIRASMPEGQGIWPALWTLGANIDQVSWPACGEIDILEMIGGEEIPSVKGEKVAHNAIHWQNESGVHDTRGSHYNVENDPLNNQYHIYSIVWTKNSITFLIDDIVRDQQDITPDHMSEFHLPHFFTVNIAVGGTWPGNPDETTVFPQRMFIDYIRVFQNK